MDKSNKFPEKSLPNEESFYSNLTVESVANSDYKHARKHKNLILLILFGAGLTCLAALKMTKVQLELLTDIHMLLMVEKRIWGGICHSVLRYTEANSNSMKNYNPHKDSSYITY